VFVIDRDQVRLEYRLTVEWEGSGVAWVVRESSVRQVREGLNDGSDWNDGLVGHTILVQINTFVLEVIEKLLVRSGDSDNLTLLAGSLDGSWGGNGSNEGSSEGVTVRSVGIAQRSDNIEALFLQVEFGGISWGLGRRIGFSGDGFQGSLGQQGSGGDVVDSSVVESWAIGKSVRKSSRIERNLTLSAACGGSLLESKKFSLGLSDFRSVLNSFGSFVSINWRFGQVVRSNAESSVISGVGDHDMFSFRVDVGV
jgi:hypothetical protein